MNTFKQPSENILIIDDRPENIHLLSHILREQGYRVRQAITAEIALSTIREKLPDLILLDIMLPDMNGYEVCKRLKADELTREIPVLFISVLDDTKDKLKAFDVGGADYLSKPFEEQEVLAHVKTHLALRNTQKQLERKIVEHKRTKDALRESEKKYRDLVETIHDVIYQTDADGFIEYISPAITVLLGYDPTAMVGQRFTQFLHEDDVEMYQEYFDIARSGFFGSIEMQIITASLDIKWIHFSCHSILVKKQLVGTRGVITDITKRKRMEKMLRESEEKYRMLFEQMSSGVAIYEAVDDGDDFIFKAFNTAGEKIEHVKKEDWIGKSVLQAFPSIKDFGLFDVFQRVFKTGKPEYFPMNFYEDQRISGWRENHVYKLPTNEIVAVYNDVTERKQAEEALRESEERLSSFMDSATDGFILFDSELNYIKMNTVALKMTGLDRKDVIGRNILDVVPNLKETGRYDKYKNVIETGEPFFISNLMPHPKFGLKHIEVKAFKVRDGLGYIFTDITERKRVEEALRESEQRLRSIGDNLPAVQIYQLMVRPDGIIRFTYVSSAVEKLHECTAEQVIADPYLLYDRVVEEDREGLRLAAEKSIREMDVFDHEIRIRRKSGEIRWHRMTSRPRLTTGNVILFDGIDMDITERKRAEEELKKHRDNLKSLVQERTGELNAMNDKLEAVNEELHQNVIELNKVNDALKEHEERFRAIFEQAAVGVAVLETNTVKFLQVNQKYADIVGYTRNELLSITFKEITHPDDLQEDLDQMQLMVDGVIREFSIEKRYICKNNLIVWIKLTVSPMWRPGEEPNYHVAIIEDITERKQAEKALLRSEKRLRTMIEKSPLPMVITDAKQDMEYFNDKFTECFGYTLNDVSTVEQWWQIAYPDEHYRKLVQQSWLDGIEYAMAHDTEIPMQEWDLTIKDRTKRHCEFYMVPFDEFSLIIINDITENIKTQTELKEAKEAAETANKAKSAFLANMSHELRTPLNAILGFAQLMLRDSDLLPSQRKNMEIVNRSGEHLLMLINDILDMSKIEAGRSILRNRNFDLFHTLTNIEEMIRVRADAVNLKFNVFCENDVPRYIKGDDRKLRQVLINLLNNAVKFTEKGSVTLQIWSSRLKIHFKIGDTGVGIAPSDLKAVFDVFRRTQSGLRNDEGTGLGLAISRKLVRLMGGDITVFSEVGKGSVFTFHIPVEPADAAEIGVESSVRKIIGLEPNQETYLILIVEDKWESREFLAQLLQSVGFAIREAVNGQEAIEMFAKERPHLIFMDMRMPVTDGFEATRIIKATPEGQEIPVIAMTASAFEEEKSAILASGCDEFIRKPTHEDEIFEAVKRHLRVRYIYEEPAKQKGVRKARTNFTLADLDTLPAEWIAEFSQAVKRGYRKPVLDLIEQIEPEKPLIAEALVKLTCDFRFDKLIALTQAIKGAKSEKIRFTI